MSAPRDYDSIPGTYVYDAERGRVGYHLNMFCMSLNKPENRAAFKADEAAYLSRFTLTPEQKDAVLKRDWLGMLRVGGNIYYTIKIAFCDGLTFQDVAGMMCGMPMVKRQPSAAIDRTAGRTFLFATARAARYPK